MALHFYIVPKIGTGTTIDDTFRPKYIFDLGRTAGVQWAAMDYGQESTMLAGADVTDAQHATLSGFSDCFAVPALDTTVGGNPMLNRIRNTLEGVSIPGSWIVASTTWRAAVGRVGRCCLVLQRVHGIGKRVFGSGRGLDTTVSAELLTDLTNAATSLGLSTAGLSTAIPIRTAILTLADRLPAFSLMNEVF